MTINRKVKSQTELFFDALKHIKNNLSNLVFFELPTLNNCKKPSLYLSLKPVNYKSKYPDLKKFGFINYKKPSDDYLLLTETGKRMLELLSDVGKDYRTLPTEDRLYSVGSTELIQSINKSKRVEFFDLITKQLLRYYDNGQSFRPYKILFDTLFRNGFLLLTDDVLLNILSQTKNDLLLKRPFFHKAFETLDENLREQVRRPKSYIIDALITSGMIDSERNITITKHEYEKLVNEDTLLEEDTVHSDSSQEQETKKGRSFEDQLEFRINLLKEYEFSCAVTKNRIGIKSFSGKEIIFVQAAHIIPYKDGGSFSINNGIPLSYDLHKYYDEGLITFRYSNNDLILFVSKSNNVIDTGYLSGLEGTRLLLPKDKSSWPNPEALKFHEDKYFLK